MECEVSTVKTDEIRTDADKLRIDAEIGVE